MSTQLGAPVAAAMQAAVEHRQLLTFMCAGEEYGVDILRVQEIKGWDGVTRVPRTPEHVLGVMNLRGTIVPVVDLRRRFGLEARPFTTATVVVVVRVHASHGEKTVGMAVDAVSEVYTLAVSELRPPPSTGVRSDDACVSGLATLGEKGEKMVMLLDIDRLMTSSIEADVPVSRQ